MTISFAPTRDRIVAKLIASATQTKTGLHLAPSTAKLADAGHETLTATVVAVGPGHLTSEGARVPLQINVGDRVTFDGKESVMIRLDGEEFLTMREDSVIAIVSGMSAAPLSIAS